MASKPVTYSCARCGKQLRNEQWLYSSWTKNRYCLNIDSCGRRARRAVRAIRPVA
jgi:hypothetical protein